MAIDEPASGPDDARARRLYVVVLAWGVLLLALLWWFKRAFQV